MNRKKPSLFVAILVVVSGLFSTAWAQNNGALTSKQQAVIPIAAFTASNDLEKLKQALNAGLDAGLTVNETKEVLVQMYAYCGFPRSLDGLNTLIVVLEERKAKGFVDVPGPDAAPFPEDKTVGELGTEIQTRLVGRPVSGPVYDFAPIIDTFLKEHLFGDIFGRDTLDFQTRELATVSALAALPAENQLRSHLGVSLNVGLTEPQMRQFVQVLGEKVGRDEQERAARLLDEVLKQRASAQPRPDEK